jgi:hypothetical protein
MGIFLCTGVGPDRAWMEKSNFWADQTSVWVRCLDEPREYARQGGIVEH